MKYMLNVALINNLGGTGVEIFLVLYFIIGAIAFFHCVLNKRISSSTKGIWVLAICLIPMIGSIGYLIGGRK
jgi:hypothetical protein